MKKIAVQFSALLLLLCTAHSAGAALIKTYVSPFAVTGAENRNEMAGGLQGLLISRLSGDTMLAMDTPAGADITVTGNYLEFRKIFSIDAVARTGEGKLVARAFVQGESREELLPAMDKLAKSLVEELRKASPAAVPVVKP